MANFLETVSSFFQKIKQKSGFSSSAELPVNPYPKKVETFDPNSIALVRSFNDNELKNFLSKESEKNLIRLLQNISDQTLQLRIIENISEQPVLQRVTRSNFEKKVKRAATKKLRSSNEGGVKNQIEKISEIAQEIQAFLENPDWTKAQELLTLSAQHELTTGNLNETHPTYLFFQGVRKRLKGEIQEFEKTCAEMEKICEQLASTNLSAPSKSNQLHSRWKDLEKKYHYPKTFEALNKYRQILNTKLNPPLRISKSESKSIGIQVQQTKKVTEAPRETPKNTEEILKQKRLQRMQQIQEKLNFLIKSLNKRETGAQLRTLHKDLLKLSGWREEFATQFDEADILIKESLKKRTEILSESEWDVWARTDRALRLLAELEVIIGSIEAETDPELTLERSKGLGERLFAAAKEMKGLGALEKKQDHQIWEHFKALSERGWVICDKLRTVIVETLKEILAQHSATPMEFLLPVLSNPRVKIDLRDSIFSVEIATRIKELRKLWGEIGGRTTDKNKENQEVFTKIFEVYSRELNLFLTETQQIEAHQKLLNEEWLKAFNQQIERTAKLENEIQKLFEKVTNKKENKLPEALKLVSSIESELSKIEKSLNHLKGKKTSTLAPEAAQEVESRFGVIRDLIYKICQDCKKLINQEIADRTLERNQVLAEAQTLVLSQEWESSVARFEELKTRWKTIGTLDQKQDSLFDLLFENIRQFHVTQAQKAKQNPSEDDMNLAFNTRKELLYSLEALNRLSQAQTLEIPFPLPMTEEEQSESVGKILALGMKYKAILSLDPKDGLFKETKKIMENWAYEGLVNAKVLPDLWNCYFERVQRLLRISFNPAKTHESTLRPLIISPVSIENLTTRVTSS